MRLLTHRRSALALAAVIVAGTLASCGGSSSPAGSGSNAARGATGGLENTAGTASTGNAGGAKASKSSVSARSGAKTSMADAGRSAPSQGKDSSSRGATSQNATPKTPSSASGSSSAGGGQESAGVANHSSGGLSISPGIFEQLARRGHLGVMQISNTTPGAMTINVALRPWLQAPSGEVSPNRDTTLGDVSVGSHSFTLNAGATQAVDLSLTRPPARRSLYGAIEVTGQPRNVASHGLTVAYRVVSSLRLDAPKGAQAFHAQAGGLVEQGSSRHGTLLLAVHNTGNTIVPVGGTALISGPGRSLRATARSKTIVPGQTVNVPLTELSGSLPPGHYTVTTHLSQGGHSIGTFTRTIQLR